MMKCDVCKNDIDPEKESFVKAEMVYPPIVKRYGHVLIGGKKKLVFCWHCLSRMAEGY